MEPAKMVTPVRESQDVELFLHKFGDLDGTRKIKAQFTYFRDIPPSRLPPDFRPDIRGESVAEKSSANPLKQLLLSAQKVVGAKVLGLIKKALDTPGVYVFGELLAMPKIQRLRNGRHGMYWRTLILFAYGTYKQYLAHKEEFLKLTPMQEKKLKLLTIVTLAAKTTSIPYSILRKELCMKNTRDLENLIIEAIYADMIQGKLDQKESQLFVVRTSQGRDVTPANIGAVAEKLATWARTCESLLICIEDQTVVANEERQEYIERKEELQEDIEYVRKFVSPTWDGSDTETPPTPSSSVCEEPAAKKIKM